MPGALHVMICHSNEQFWAFLSHGCWRDQVRGFRAWKGIPGLCGGAGSVLTSSQPLPLKIPQCRHMASEIWRHTFCVQLLSLSSCDLLLILDSGMKTDLYFSVKQYNKTKIRHWNISLTLLNMPYHKHWSDSLPFTINSDVSMQIMTQRTQVSFILWVPPGRH